VFTGIIEEVATLLSIEPTGLVLHAREVLKDLGVKDSIAVDGICLTVIERGEDWFRVETMPETLRRTRLNTLQAGDVVNLERSLIANGRIGGHIVQGHIEATAQVLALRSDGIGLDVEIERPEPLAPYIIAKCFIAVNGISLTVVDSLPDHFSISLIPYTREHTNLGQIRVGTVLNLETDIVGRYIMQSSVPYMRSIA
jgi:riboflavin synthase